MNYTGIMAGALKTKQIFRKTGTLLVLSFIIGNSSLLGQITHVTNIPPIQVNGVFPSLSLVGNHEGRSETGIGAFMVWGDKWVENIIISDDRNRDEFEVFPEGYSAQWVRIIALNNVKDATVQFVDQ